jgi:large subunit ribosomal protein L18
MNNQANKRIRRHNRVRAVVHGTSARPRLSVYRSNQSIYAQLIDDSSKKTLLAAHSREAKKAAKTKITQAAEVGRIIAEKAKKQNISTVVFDRGGYRYHGRVKAMAEAAREQGLVF